MNTINNDLINEAADYVTKLLSEKLPENIKFHTIEHTKYVAEKAEIIGKKSGLNSNSINLVKLCAWFHDTGYIINPENHEETGAEIAADFLKNKGIDEKTISKIKKCIKATRTPQSPDSPEAEILCDADLFHLTEEFYFKIIEKMREEKENISGKNISKQKFYLESEQFFLNHKYHTEFAKKELQPKKEKILKKLQTEIENMKKKKKDKKKKNKKTRKYSRGVESMLRNTARMQINLSSIADKKSNILISVNTIIMSISMTFLISKFEEMPNIIIPVIIVLLFCVVTVIFAILSTRPVVSSGTFTEEDLKQKKVNLLFFGNFYNMELEKYEKALREVMKNEDDLYSAMIHDQYALGKVLAKKYKLLRISYNVFITGIIITVVSFILSFLSI
ncbi:MAG: HD domain-containing protein [Chlorobi bacterium]|nr:HD domain-containing protein [Chlorobiota bacterium]